MTDLNFLSVINNNYISPPPHTQQKCNRQNIAQLLAAHQICNSRNVKQSTAISLLC